MISPGMPDSAKVVLILFLIEIDTLGNAFAAGWRVFAL
jgi:hypothetical protein